MRPMASVIYMQLEIVENERKSVQGKNIRDKPSKYCSFIFE